MADRRNDAASSAPPVYSAPVAAQQADDTAQLRALKRSLRNTRITLQRAVAAYQESMTLLRHMAGRDDR
jgi:hypothetical protein